jgi:6-phosphogluconolactonase
MRRAIESISMLFVMATLLLPSNAKADDDSNHSAHAVFIMSNSAERNEVIAFTREADGTLHESGKFPTEGRGSGGNNDPLESQGALTLSQDHSLLFAVNAGSGEISVFDVHGSHLELSDKVQSEGSEPNAIAQHGNLVYVLNTGGSSNVAGFVLEGDHLHYINNSLSFLSTNTSGAASIAFSPDGTFLAVTERLTNDIDVFKVQADGTLSPIIINPSGGPGAFSVSFAPNGVALVSETGPANVSIGSAISSYAIHPNGTLSAISTSVPTLGGANCWNVVTPDSRPFFGARRLNFTVDLSTQKKHKSSDVEPR